MDEVFNEKKKLNLIILSYTKEQEIDAIAKNVNLNYNTLTDANSSCEDCFTFDTDSVLTIEKFH